LQTPVDAQGHFVLVSQPLTPQNQCKRGSQNTWQCHCCCHQLCAEAAFVEVGFQSANPQKHKLLTPS
jgi:hypothetical protein